MINYLDIQEAIWNAISSINRYPVVDYIGFDEIEPPFIRLGNLYFDENSVKNGEGVKAQQYINIYSISFFPEYVLYINIYSTYSGKKEIIQMMDEVNRVIDNINIEGHQVRIKKGHVSLSLAKDQLGSIHLRMDKNNNKFYHAVMVFDIYIY